VAWWSAARLIGCRPGVDDAGVGDEAGACRSGGGDDVAVQRHPDAGLDQGDQQHAVRAGQRRAHRGRVTVVHGADLHAPLG
jgi:hypothetical protein